MLRIIAGEKIETGLLIRIDPAPDENFVYPAEDEEFTYGDPYRVYLWDYASPTPPHGIAMIGADFGGFVTMMAQGFVGTKPPAPAPQIRGRTFRLMAGSVIEANQSVMIDEGTHLIMAAEDKSQVVGCATHAAKVGDYVEVSPMIGRAVSSTAFEIRPYEYEQRVKRLAALQAEHAGRHN